MPYVTSTGELVDSEPWSLRYVVRVIGEAIGVISLFFTSMLPFDVGDSSRNSNQRRPSGRSPPNIGEVRRLGGIAPPPCSASG
nr:Retrovirus Pol polyprotein [Hymenolepis microstoma]